MALQHLKHRVSQLEGSGQQIDALRRENAMLQQRVMDMEAAVSSSRRGVEAATVLDLVTALCSVGWVGLQRGLLAAVY